MDFTKPLPEAVVIRYYQNKISEAILGSHGSAPSFDHLDKRQRRRARRVNARILHTREHVRWREAEREARAWNNGFVAREIRGGNLKTCTDPTDNEKPIDFSDDRTIESIKKLRESILNHHQFADEYPFGRCPNCGMIQPHHVRGCHG